MQNNLVTNYNDNVFTIKITGPGLQFETQIDGPLAAEIIGMCLE